MGERYGGGDPPPGQRGGGTGSQDSAGGALDPDSVYAVLDHTRRRLVLEVVAEFGSVTRRDLATQVAARERGIAPHAVTDEHRRSVAIALYHVHVPKLAEAGVIDVGEGADRIRSGPNAGLVIRAMERLDPTFDPDAGATSPDG